MPAIRQKSPWNFLRFWRKIKEKRDVATLEKSGLLDPEFLGETYRDKTAQQIARKYLRSWANRKAARKPFPGFHPGIYADRTGLRKGDSLVHWITAGKPEGPWVSRVIRPSEKPVVLLPGTEDRIALQIHVYYTDVLPGIIARLNTNSFRPDLLVSVSDSCDEKEVRAALSSYPGCFEISRVPNRGRDLGPLITAFGSRILKDYNVVGHVHTKKTLWHSDPEVGKVWREFLLENTLGGTHPMMDTILSVLLSQKELGLVFPEDSWILDWDSTKPECARLMQKMGLTFDWGNNIMFPAGSFFWARTEALRPLFELGLGWDDYQAEPIANGGTLLHALERLLFCVTIAKGFRSASTYVPGVGR